MKFVALPAFTDNPLRMLPTRDAVRRVGPRGAAGDRDSVEGNGLQLAGILVTGRASADLTADCRTAQASPPAR